MEASSYVAGFLYKITRPQPTGLKGNDTLATLTAMSTQQKSSYNRQGIVSGLCRAEVDGRLTCEVAH